MKKQKMASIELSENHRRSISITLQLVDQALCEWDDWTSGLGGYGRVPEELGRYLDPLGEKLTEQMNAIIALLT
jgi:hypothetical protein